MHYTTKSPSLQRLNAEQGKWVAYQLKLRGITQAKLSAWAGCSQPQVSNTLAGRTASSKIYIVLCNILGYSSIGDLLVNSKRSAA